MRRVARRTSLESHRPMLEGERTPLIAMAIQTPRFIGAERLRHRVPDAPVRIVAIDAAHRSLRHLMVKRLLELTRHR